MAQGGRHRFSRADPRTRTRQVDRADRAASAADDPREGRHDQLIRVDPGRLRARWSAQAPTRSRGRPLLGVSLEQRAERRAGRASGHRMVHRAPSCRNGVKRTQHVRPAVIDPHIRERARRAAIYACMRWRDENIRTTNAYRIWADADTPSAWRAYQDAFDREHEALVRYTELAVRAGDLSQGASAHSAADAPADRP